VPLVDDYFPELAAPADLVPPAGCLQAGLAPGDLPEELQHPDDHSQAGLQTGLPADSLEAYYPDDFLADSVADFPVGSPLDAPADCWAELPWPSQAFPEGPASPQAVPQRRQHDLGLVAVEICRPGTPKPQAEDGDHDEPHHPIHVRIEPRV